MYDLQKKNWIRFSYKDWYAYFKRNDACRLNIDFSDDQPIQIEDRELILPSVRAFQKGEHSEGYQFLEMAKKFSKEYDEPLYTEAISMFIREENFHSAYLARFMEHYGMQMERENTLDKIFRSLRHKGGLFTEIAVLVTAEIIALSYYSALGNVADKIGSPSLKAICGQMLHDELPHIVFQSYTLSHYSNDLWVRIFRRFLMERTSIFVYAFYGKLLKAGGYDFSRFKRANIGYLYQSFEIIKNMQE